MWIATKALTTLAGFATMIVAEDQRTVAIGALLALLVIAPMIVREARRAG